MFAAFRIHELELARNRICLPKVEEILQITMHVPARPLSTNMSCMFMWLRKGLKTSESELRVVIALLKV